jgi:hypothetical protein
MRSRAMSTNAFVKNFSNATTEHVRRGAEFNTSRHANSSYLHAIDPAVYRWRSLARTAVIAFP